MIPCSFLGYDLATTAGVRVLFRDPVTNTLRQSTVLHSNFQPRPGMAFKKCVENLKVTREFCEAMQDTVGDKIPQATAVAKQTHLQEERFTTMGSLVQLRQESVQEAVAPEEVSADDLVTRAVCRRACLQLDPGRVPEEPSKSQEPSKGWLRAMRFTVFRAALFGSTSVPEDMCVALGRVGAPSCSDLQRESAEADAASGCIALAVYVSPKKALESPERKEWMEAIDKELQEVLRGTLEAKPASEVTSEDDVLPALLLLNRKKMERSKRGW